MKVICAAILFALALTTATQLGDVDYGLHNERVEERQIIKHCNMIATCTECTNTSHCAWCGNNQQQQCVDEGTTKCLDNSNGSKTCSATDGQCSTIQGCDNCQRNQLLGCSFCTNSQGKGSCVSSATGCQNQKTVIYCDASCQYSFCDMCQDAGCVWCADGTCQNPQYTTCAITHTCESYCESFDTCDACQAVRGCGWCEDTQGGSRCSDVDQTTCQWAHTCSSPSPAAPHCGFSGGDFVGGMFFVIGLGVLSVGGFLFYRWKTGGKLSYTELR